MIKKTLLGLGITFLSFIGFSSAITLSKTYQNGSYVGGKDNIEMAVYNRGMLGSNRLGNVKRMIGLGSVETSTYTYRKYFWWNDGKAYFYSYVKSNNSTTKRAGYFTRFSLCNAINGVSNSSVELTGCNQDDWGDGSFASDFFNSITSSDYWGLTNSSNGSRNFNICFSSSSYGKSICFMSDTAVSNNFISISMDDDIDYISFPNSLLGDPPGRSTSGGGNGNTNSNTTTTNYTCPTIRQLMQSMGNNYNTGLCYNNTNYYNGTNFEQIEKEDIFTIFNDDYENYTNRISIYRNNCNAPATNQACGNAFSGEFKKFSIISNAINSKVDEKNLWNYCNLGLNFDPNATTCTLNGSGIIKEEYTTEEEIQNIIDSGTIPTPTTNTNTGENDNVINVLNNCENGDRECYINDRNFIESLSNIYGKITGLFKERKNVNGIIPEYILRITYITILFTVIFKK